MFLTPNFILADVILRDDFFWIILQIPRKTSVLDFPLSTAIGIGSSIWQCHLKCRPMLVLQQQKKCCKGFHICSLSFQVLQWC